MVSIVPGSSRSNLLGRFIDASDPFDDVDRDTDSITAAGTTYVSLILGVRGVCIGLTNELGYWENYDAHGLQWQSNNALRLTYASLK